MKKFLAMTLALALALGLAVPALAEEALDPFYTVDGEPVEAVPISDVIWTGEESDDHAAYEAAHPEEIANLDVDALIAGWGYQDYTAQKQFMDSEGWWYDTVEEAVKDYYINQRLLVEDICADAEEYRAAYPEEWESFDADTFFANEVQRDWDSGYQDTAHYMAYYNILTKEEFVDDMFVWYIDDYYSSDDSYDKNGEPTLTLMVNGVASDATVTAVDGVSYVDAAALRAILGNQAVAAGVTGPVAVRAAAETAGWDVAWYGGGWRGVDQEIQLWDKHAFEAKLDQEFGPLNDFMARLMTMSREALTSKEAIAGKETVDVTLTQFSTLDGSKDYKLSFVIDYVVQNAVIDMTVTFDVSQLLQMISPADLARLGKNGAPTLDQLAGLLRAGKMEFLIDYNRGVVACNIPLLALLDEDLSGWQTQYLDGWDEVKETLFDSGELTFTSTLYASMVSTASRSWGGGAEKALEEYNQSVGALRAFFGKERFTTVGGKTTYTLTTQAVNRALGEALALKEPGKASFFKACELTYALDERGGVVMDMHIRPDMEGISAATTASQDEDDPYFTFGASTMMGAILRAFDMDVTASGSGDQSRATSRVKIHWNNVGTMDMRCETTAGAATRTPRRIEDVERSWVYPRLDGGEFGRELLALVGR